MHVARILQEVGAEMKVSKYNTSTFGASKGKSAKHIKSSQLVNSPLGFTLSFTTTLIVTILAKHLRMYIGFNVVRCSGTIQWVLLNTINRGAPIC